MGCKEFWTLFFLTTCMAMGFMLSPLSLVILGNGAGLSGHWLLWTLPIFAVFNLWTAYLYSRWLTPTDSFESKIYKEANSKRVLSILKLSCLVPFCIGASTLILAMAGYALNEIFFYWFPNLIFSVCVLVFIVAINLISSMVSRSFQGLSVIIFLASMLILMILGFLNWEKPVFETKNIPHIAQWDWRSLVLVLWLFMAAELILYNDMLHQNHQVHILSLMVAFVVAVAIFWLWGRISLHFASLERLADSTVPHSIVARAIAGENGRKIMGVVILTGSFASVNTLLAGVSAVVVSMGKSGQIFSVMKTKVFKGNTAILFLSTGILCMLLTGMAGKDITGTLTRSAFYVWLVSHAAFNVFVFRQLGRSGGKKNKKLILPAFLTSMAYVAGSVFLIATDPELSMVIAFITGFILLSMLTVLKRKENDMTTTKIKPMIILTVFVLVTLITAPYAVLATEIPRITKEEAREMMENPDVVFLDVRSGSDWRASDIKISGAVHEDPANLKEWISNYDLKKTYILYCA